MVLVHENDKRYLRLLRQFRAGAISKKSVLGKIIVCDAMSFIETEDGGPGSGNFGHRGRPGLVGVSGAGGGKAYRTGNKESGYVSIAKAKAFQSIAANARNSKDYHSFVHSLSKEQQQQIKDQHSQSGTKESLRNYTERLRQIMSAPPAKVSGVKFKLVEGSDISAMYKWDGKDYTDEKTGQVIDTEIEDIIHKQGFDGVPKVVSQEEFDRIAKEHPEMPLLLRSYSAPDADTLHDYDKQLEEGAWYVDCGVGGAQYGQGMYAVGLYGEKKGLGGAMEEMRHYRKLNEEKQRSKSDMNRIYKVGEEPPTVSAEGSDKVYARTGMAEQAELSKIKEGEVYCLSYDFAEDGYRRDMLITRKDGKIIKMSDPDTEIKQSRIDGILKDKSPTIQKMIETDEVRGKPQSSTRMMTLDPSAKIIKYNDLKAIRMGLVSNSEKERIKKEEFEKFINDKENAMPDGMLAFFRHRQGMDRDEQETDAYYKASAEYDTWDKVSREAFAHRLLDLERDFRQKYRESVDKVEDLAIEKSAGLRGYHDYGVMAAALGYDAINAGGHGATGSYTVVLNRTKVILSDQRVKVER